MESSPTFDEWIGRESIAEDEISDRLLTQFRATLSPDLSESQPAIAPWLIHWCLAPPAAPSSALGKDGHPRTGDFLPPVPLPRRMWAAGRLWFTDPLRPGDHVKRTSTITNISRKQGRTGEMWFVTVTHDLSTARGAAIREEQSLVYRAVDAAASPPQPVPLTATALDPVLEFPEVRLFRYSALTFNGHRIHYDTPYATGVEGYPGLVVHGPLQATLLAHAAARRLGTLKSFEFRATSPLIAPGNARLHISTNGNGLSLYLCDQSGRMTMQASAT